MPPVLQPADAAELATLLRATLAGAFPEALEGTSPPLLVLPPARARRPDAPPPAAHPGPRAFPRGAPPG